MGKHLKPEPNTVRGICIECGEKPQRSAGKRADGKTKFSSLCGKCTHQRNPQKKPSKRPERYWENWKRSSYRSHKKDKCEECGFIPQDPCQLDVDHIDGDHNNHDPKNLQTLCANCHRLKTKMNGDGVYRNKQAGATHGTRS